MKLIVNAISRKLLWLTSREPANNHLYDPNLEIRKKIMKRIHLMALLLTMGALQVAANVHAQRVTLDVRNVPLETVLKDIKKQTGYGFVLDGKDLKEMRISVHAENEALDDVLKKCFAGKPVMYRISGKDVFLKKVAVQTPVSGRAQQPPIRGVVVDEDQQPIPGVSVKIKDSGVGTATDENGAFSLAAPDQEAVLLFSVVGYASREVRATPGNMRIVMAVLSADLNEVVVVGYGTQKKETLTGAISSIRNKEIQTTTHTSLAQKLQGKVPGLRIRQNSGGPGDFDNAINIRGFGSPLFVIDGVARDGANEFQRLNPEDIESISVLKDASAAVYGLRAANGVIIVTTKKGQPGETNIKYNGAFGLQRATDVPQMASAAQWAQLRNDASFLVSGTPFFTQEELQKYIDGAPGYGTVDWYGATIRSSTPQMVHDLSINGGNEKTQFFTSIGHAGEQGLLRSGDMSYGRYTFRSNIVTEIARNLKAEVLLGGRYDKREIPGMPFFDIFKGTRTNLPTEQIYANGNPDYLAQTLSGLNPVALMDRNLTGYNEDVTRSFQSTLSLTYQVPFVEGLSLRGLAAYDGNNFQGKNLFKAYPLYTYNGQTDTYTEVTQRQGSANLYNGQSNSSRLTFQGQVNYERTFAGKHHVSALALVEQQEWWERYTNLQRFYGDFYTIDQINFAPVNNQQSSGMENETASLSFIGRLNYDFQGKYLLEMAFREDGSYRYHPDRRWGFFPVVSAGYRISEERFVKDRISWLSNLKLRASYGTVGEDAGNPFQYVSAYSLTGAQGYEFVNGTYVNGIGAPTIVNEHLTWFKSNVLDIGIDLGLFNNRFSLVFDVYQRDRSGLLAVRNVSLPNTFGGTLPEENLNSDRVRGLDFVVGYQDRIGEFSYGASANFNYARTMNRYVERSPFVNSYDHWRNGTENRWNDIRWGYVIESQFQSKEEILYAPIQNADVGNVRELPGDFRYKDMNGDGAINDNDMVPMFFNENPKYYYGLNLQASYKGFDFNMLWQGAGKFSVRFNEIYAENMWGNGNTPEYFFDRWRLSDPYDLNSEWIPGTWPASRFISGVGMMYAENAMWRRDASFIRLKSVELGYTFALKGIARIGVKQLRIYGNAHNLLTFADSFVKPFDPEKVAGNYNAGFTYPLTQSFNMGVSVTF